MERKDEASHYEQMRRARMEENKRRMMELGLSSVSQSLFIDVRKKKKTHRPVGGKACLPAEHFPSRRSARLKDGSARSCNEIDLPAKPSAVERQTSGELIWQASVPEVYTEEHEKLLGEAKEDWTLFQDGYKNGERVYDNVKGRTCHQCRQKTLGLRTYCCQCQALQGQFCGDCLYMRYGENVKEALQNKDWKCPVCRDICNCSICRHRKGWPATGSLYRTACELGYKSVAHYLILARRSWPSGAGQEQKPDVEDEEIRVLEAEEAPGSKARRELKYGPEEMQRDVQKQEEQVQATTMRKVSRTRGNDKVFSAGQPTSKASGNIPEKQDAIAKEKVHEVLVISGSDEDDESQTAKVMLAAVRSQNSISSRLRSKVRVV